MEKKQDNGPQAPEMPDPDVEHTAERLGAWLGVFDQTGMMQDKWAQTGWNIEQNYGNNVLLGNWERLLFTREPKTANSTNRVDYRPHWDFKPDVSERRSALLSAEPFLLQSSKRRLIKLQSPPPPPTDYAQVSIPEATT